MTDMQICVLSDSELKGFDPSQYLETYSWDVFIPQKPVNEYIHTLDENGKYDVYFDLCDGAEDPQEEMQSVVEVNGIDFARGVNITSVDELEEVEDLTYPLMMKHPQSFASTAMTRNSRVESPPKLREQVKRICTRFGSARVEEFIDGPEFIVLVADNPDDLEHPFVYPPAELVFPPGEDFLHSRVKWKEWVYLKPVEHKALSSKLKEMACSMYQALDGVGYARCDIRMGTDQQLHMIEINPNCGILFKPEDLGPADVMMEYDQDGHAGFLDRFFRTAIIRNQAGMPTPNKKSR